MLYTIKKRDVIHKSNKRFSLLAFSAGALVTASLAATFYLSNMLTEVSADEGGSDFCVTATLAEDIAIKAERGNCSNTGTPEEPEITIPVTYSNETIIGWASQSFTHMSEEEAAFGVENGMLSTYSDFVNEKYFPADYANEAKKRGASLLVAWEPYDWEKKLPDGRVDLNQPELRPANIAAGAYDEYLTEWLTAAQTHTKDIAVLVRFAPEMNDSIRPWSIGVNGGNTTEDYISMWKHVYEIKETVAPDVEMMWNPLVAGSDPSGNIVSLSSVYPGSDYVDILALDGFNWGNLQKKSEDTDQCGWQSYDDVFKEPIKEIKSLAGTKPWGIAEVSSVSLDKSFFEPSGACYDGWGSWVNEWPESGEHYKTADDWITQAGWMKTMIKQAHDDGALFVNMFNTEKETDWRLNSTESGVSVLKDITSNTSFKAGSGSSDLINAALK